MSKKLYVFVSLLIVLSFALTVSAVAELKPGDPLPRTETLYHNGQQWGPVVCWNPYSNNCNNAMAIDPQADNARVTMFETPYLYNMLDGKQYPLLADGDYATRHHRGAIGAVLERDMQQRQPRDAGRRPVLVTPAVPVRSRRIGCATLRTGERLLGHFPPTFATRFHD